MPRALIVVGSGDYTGASRMAHSYGKALRRAGWEVFFVVGDRPKGKVRCLAEILAEEGFPLREEQGFLRLLNPSLIKKVRRILRDQGADLVFSTVQCDLKVAAPAAILAGIPLCVLDQTTHQFHGGRLIRKVKKLYFGFLMRRAAHLICVGQAVADQATREFGCSTKRVSVLENGISVANVPVKEDDPSNLPRREDGVLRIVNVGRLDKQKGQHILLEAIALLSEDISVDVFLVGDKTPNDQSSEAYAETLRERAGGATSQTIHFLGWRDNVRAVHQTADIYVHSALWEGPPLPLAVLEAMASGLPVIISDCAGRPAGFDDGIHGKIVEAGNADALAKAISWMARLSAQERRKIGDNGRAFVEENYDIEVLEKRFVTLCSNIVEKEVA